MLRTAGSMTWRHKLIELDIPSDRYTGQDFDIDPDTVITGRRRTVARRSMSPSLEHREYGEFVPVSEIRASSS